MADWTGCVMNPQAIASIFGNQPPALDGADIHSIVFDRDGPVISLSVTLRDYQENPPRKWVEQQANRAQISLQLIGVQAVTLEGWGTENICDLEIRRAGSTLNIRTSNGTFQMSIDTSFIRIAGLSAHRDEAR